MEKVLQLILNVFLIALSITMIAGMIGGCIVGVAYIISALHIDHVLCWFVLLLVSTILGLCVTLDA